MSTARLVGIAVLGWALFGLTLWYDHRPQPPEIVPPKTAAALKDAGFTEAKVSPAPPPSVIAKAKTIPGTERIAHVAVAAHPSEKTPPTIHFVPGNCTAEAQEADAQQVANWTLRPGDLGLRDGSIDIRKVGRHAFVAFKGTVTAQTPDGDVARTITPKADAWVSTKALGIPPRFGPMFRGTVNLTKLELRSIEAGVYWTKGRTQQDASVGREKGGDWIGGYGVRF